MVFRDRIILQNSNKIKTIPMNTNYASFVNGYFTAYLAVETNLIAYFGCLMYVCKKFLPHKVPRPGHIACHYLIY